MTYTHAEQRKLTRFPYMSSRSRNRMTESLAHINSMANEIADIAIKSPPGKPEALMEALANVSDIQWARFISAVRYPGDLDRLADLCRG